MTECRLRIRGFRRGDLDGVLEVEEKSFPPSQVYSREVFLGYSRSCGYGFLVADLCGLIMGYIIGCLIEDFGHIVSLAVHPNYRGRGVGSKLLSALEEILRSRGARVLTLEVAVSNTIAIKLYEKHGFRKVMRLYKYYGSEDAWLMVKQFIEKT